MKKFLRQKEQIKEMYKKMDEQDDTIEENNKEIEKLLKELEELSQRKKSKQSKMVAKEVMTDSQSCDATTITDDLISKASTGVQTDITVKITEHLDMSTATDDIKITSLGTMTTTPTYVDVGTSTTEYMAPTQPPVCYCISNLRNDDLCLACSLV